MRKHLKTIILLVAIFFAASIFYGLGIGGFGGRIRRENFGLGGKEKILAKVNGKEVDALRYRQILSRVLSGFKEEIGPSDLAFVENLALGQAIDFQIILSETKKKVRVSKQELEATISNIRQAEKFSSPKELETALKRSGLTLSRFKDLLKEEILVQKLIMKIRESVKVIPDDLREIKASHILVSEEATAQKLLERIKKGEDFAALAKKYSLDPASKEKGGDLGYFTTGMMVEPFEKAAFSLKVGQISEVVKSPFGYHIIKTTDSRLRKLTGQEKDLEKAVLAQKQEQAFKKWYSEIKSQAKVEIVDPLFRGHGLRFQGRLAEALVEYKKARQIYPTNPYLYVYLADTYSALGQKASALDYYQKAAPFAADSLVFHKKLLEVFKKLNSKPDIIREQKEIKRIEKKEKFEKELQQEK